MNNFGYHRPSELAEATALLMALPEARPLAGGMTLIPTLKQQLASPAALVDLGGIGELRGIRVGDDDVTIGAMTRHAEVARSTEIRRLIPALSGLADSIGDPQVRNCGTLGGSIANNDPAADYPAAVLGLAATITTTSRAVSADDFFRGMFETALEAGEIVTQVTFPVPSAAGYEKVLSPASRYPLVGVFVAKTTAGIRVAVTGAAPCVFRATAMEQVLSRQFVPDALTAIRIPATGLASDIHGDAEYRAHLIGVLAKRAVKKAIEGSESH
jgi:aerobic carbon-monoxide dehydrogenase medium subunit